ncbi:hypothetical protein M441DRAFT_84485 [Trichoderma asperellum CBS 433.97]|uniref:Annexin n=1 Tax=Trichoderma asperellum (strain ATCC 204424 / CBS 433.97 / NBRC 101777) TaxID=1042311 RepID=A0A2T3YSU5_TRIA4|nr:hypothetical protein M441DRAFT_84485 [Trichoderma asperellum CBS 433.97]PTB35589.1 hypothetical protein M441DRAFT_84485 [Trichoderma asperellum CBS 433.97]
MPFVARQPFYGYGSAPAGSYQGQPSSYQPPYPPAGAPGQQYPGQQQAPGYMSGYNDQSTQYGQHYTHQPVPQSPYSHQAYGAAPYGYNIQPTPASPGYDPAQKLMVQRIDTSADVEALRKAMKGMGCDERALVRVFANHKYQNPWAFQQLRNDYESRFMRDLVKDVKGETRGDFEDALVALIRGPLDHDVYTLDKALDRAGTDEEALMDVLLCRSNADIRAIAAEYRHVKGKDLLAAIKDDVDDTLFRLYSMVLSATRAEDAAPVVPADIDHKITELQRATEGIIGTNDIAVAQIFTSANAAQLRAMSIAYQHKYHRSLQDVIEREFRGDMEDALLRMLTSATEDGGKADADALRAPLLKTLQNKKIITYRVLRLYWGDRARLYAAQAAHQKFYHKTLTKELKESLSGDYENLMVALIGEK